MTVFYAAAEIPEGQGSRGMLVLGWWAAVGAPAVWAMDAVWRPFTPVATIPSELRVGVGGQWGVVPPFWAADRDRSQAELEGVWRPGPGLQLELDVTALRDRYPSGLEARGWGDITLGTWARLARAPSGAGLHLGWRVKLPNATDGDELGTDETDVVALIAGHAPLGPLTLGLTGGLAILGDPLQFANQDDIGLSWATATLPVGPVVVSGRAGGAWPTGRNPGRLEAGLGVEGQCPWLFGGEATAGLSPAAPDWGLRAWAGWGWGCPRPDRD